jgi:hypothetical protein
MAKLMAHKSNQPVGWIQVPENQNFGWALRLPLATHLTITVPVRVHTRDRGWTQYYFAELDGLTQAQLDALVANNMYEPAEAVA